MVVVCLDAVCMLLLFDDAMIEYVISSRVMNAIINYLSCYDNLSINLIMTVSIVILLSSTSSNGFKLNFNSRD